MTRRWKGPDCAKSGRKTRLKAQPPPWMGRYRSLLPTIKPPRRLPTNCCRLPAPPSANFAKGGPRGPIARGPEDGSRTQFNFIAEVSFTNPSVAPTLLLWFRTKLLGHLCHILSSFPLRKRTVGLRQFDPSSTCLIKFLSHSFTWTVK